MVSQWSGTVVQWCLSVRYSVAVVSQYPYPVQHPVPVPCTVPHYPSTHHPVPVHPLPHHCTRTPHTLRSTVLAHWQFCQNEWQSGLKKTPVSAYSGILNMPGRIIVQWAFTNPGPRPSLARVFTTVWHRVNLCLTPCKPFAEHRVNLCVTPCKPSMWHRVNPLRDTV